MKATSAAACPNHCRHGFDNSLLLDLPPLAMVVFKR